MELAMVGLGRMGGNMARRLLRGGHRVVVWNRTFAKAQELEGEQAHEFAEPVRQNYHQGFRQSHAGAPCRDV